MELIGFPIKISEINKMRQDRDMISLCFSYSCILFVVLLVFSLAANWLNLSDHCKELAILFLVLSVVCLAGLYISRPYFSSDTARYKRLDKLKGTAYEEALEKMPDNDRERYLSKTGKVNAYIERHSSPLEIIFDIRNPSGRFWSMVSADGNAAWQYRIEIRNNSSRTLRNVSVTTEHLGQMSILPTDKIFIKSKKQSCDLKPQTSELIAIFHWPIPKIQPGMLAGKSALEYGPIKITAAADDTTPAVKLFDFDFQTEQMLFERT